MPMNLPVRQFNALASQCKRPGSHVLIDAVDQSAVKIEQDGREAGTLFRAMPR